MQNHKFRFICSALLIFIVLLGSFGYWLFYSRFASTAAHTYLYIDKDDNIDSIYTKLEQTAHPQQMLGLKMMCKILDYDTHIRIGKYEVGDGYNTVTIVRNLRNKRQVPVRLVIPNIRTLEKLSAQLDKVIEPDSTELIQCFRDSAICRQLGYDVATLSCIFIPNTYEIYWDITPEKLLSKMKKESDKFWTEERKQKAEDKGLTIVEAITLASIVDQETANNAEKPAIAGMYLNRLRKNMLLQADPTVKFALQQFALRRILHEHLKYDSPYNTYIYKGLPPGPISVPAISSIDAVLNAENNDYIYMCAKEDFSGCHNFAKTYSEHLQNARKYTRALNQRGIK